MKKFETFQGSSGKYQSEFRQRSANTSVKIWFGGWPKRVLFYFGGGKITTSPHPVVLRHAQGVSMSWGSLGEQEMKGLQVWWQEAITQEKENLKSSECSASSSSNNSAGHHGSNLICKKHHKAESRFWTWVAH